MVTRRIAASHPGRSRASCRRRITLHLAPAVAAAILVVGLTSVTPVEAVPPPAVAAAAPASVHRTAPLLKSQRAVTTLPTVGVGQGPDWLALDPGTHTLYTANDGDGTVSVVDTSACNDRDVRGCSQSVHAIRLPSGAGPAAIAVDPATGTAYVADINLDKIWVLNTRTCNATRFTGCGQVPVGIADPADPGAVDVNQATDTAYVGNLGADGTGDTVSVVNGMTCNGHDSSGCAQTPATVTVGQTPVGVTVDPFTDTVYVANDGSSNDGTTVSVIDGAACNGLRHAGCSQPPASVTVGDGPGWVALDHAAHTAYVANQGDNTVSVVDTATCDGTVHTGCDQIPPAVPVGTQPWALSVDTARHTVYAINQQVDTMSVINADTCNAADHAGCAALPPTAQVGGAPEGVITDPSTGTVYVANASENTVSVVNPDRCDARHAVGCRHPAPAVAVGAAPNGIGVDRAADSVYVANTGDNTVSVINTDTCNTLRRGGCANQVTVPVGNSPSGVAVDQATHTVYVSNYGDNTVSVIDTTTCRAGHPAGCAATAPTVAVGADPYGIAVDQATDTIYVANRGDSDTGDTVSVIDGATCNGRTQRGCTQQPATVTVGSGPFGVGVDQRTDTVYVSNAGQPFASTAVLGHTVSVINGATCNGSHHAGCGQIPPTVEVGLFPYGVTTDEATNKIYVADNANGDGPAGLSVINGTTCDAADVTGCDTAAPMIGGIGRAARAVAFDPATHTVYTVNHRDDTISVVHPNAPAAVDAPTRVAIGDGPSWMTIDPDNHTIYATDVFANTVSILPEQPPQAR